MRRRGAIGHALLKITKGLTKAIAALLTFCICCAAVVGCCMAALIAVDAVQEHGGSAYVALKDRVENLGQKLIKRIDGEGATEEQMIAFIRSQLTEMAESQLQVDEMLLAELNSGAYAMWIPRRAEVFCPTRDIPEITTAAIPCSCPAEAYTPAPWRSWSSTISGSFSSPGTHPMACTTTSALWESICG